VVDGYWPWWAGALGLGGSAVTYLFLLRKPMGMSGAYARALNFRQELSAEQEERAAFLRPDARRELVEATVADMRASGVPEAEIDALVKASTQAPLQSARTPMAAQLVFLLAVAVGALASAVLSGRLSLQLSPGGLQTQLFGAGVGTVAALFGGGLLVGTGTRLAGGCTSGHGLSGCGRFEPASLVATAAFFGAGVGVSLLLARVLA
jgi:uncharacterized protein